MKPVFLNVTSLGDDSHVYMLNIAQVKSVHFSAKRGKKEAYLAFWLDDNATNGWTYTGDQAEKLWHSFNRLVITSS